MIRSLQPFVKSALWDFRNRMHQELDSSGSHTGFDYDLAPARLDAVEPGLRSFYA